MLTSYHVHSNRSDGTSSIRALVQAAVAAGVNELGISDHYVHLTNGKIVDWSMMLSELPAYFKEIKAAADEVKGKLVVRLGLEADFDPKTWRDLAKVLRSYPLDYVIGSVHFVDGFPIDDTTDYWDDLSEPERNDMMRGYYTRMKQMAETGIFDFAGHLDLCKKFGHKPTIDLSADIAAVLDAIAASRMAVEVNTAGYYLPAEEAYPSLAILQECNRRSIPVVLNADTHSAENLTRGFDKGRQLIIDAGYTHTAVFAARKMSLIPLSD